MFTALVLAAAISGRVVYCDGSALPGVTVKGAGKVTVTDENGAFVLHVPDNDSVRIEAELTGMFPAEAVAAPDRFVELVMSVNMLACCTVPSNVTARPESDFIEGRVTDQNGAPLQATVRILDSGERVETFTSTDGEGGFRTDLLPFGVYTLEVAAPAYETKRMKLRLADCVSLCEAGLILRLAQD